MTALRRRYRARFATRGADEVEGSVEFVLDLGTLTEAPVVRGSAVNVLAGRTEVRPFSLEGVDRDGWLIDAFADEGRWTALGRLVDVQHQLASLDPALDPWTTYGTGRCSALDELDGPGKFRFGISDESWVARKGRIWTEADTTQLWPSGVRWSWRGLSIARDAAGVEIDQSGDFYRIRFTASGRGAGVTSDLVDWIERDAKPPEVRGDEPGSFRHLRLRWPNTNQVMVDWEVSGFGALPGYSVESLASAADADPDGTITVDVWIYWPGTPFAAPDPSGDGFLYAPTAPPDGNVRLHLGVWGDHPWGTDTVPGTMTGGYLHVADLTRRVWQAIGVRYNEASLAAIEADRSFPPMAPIIESPPDDPEEWMAREVWGPNGLIALKDPQGRRKLVDLRAPPEGWDLLIRGEIDVTEFPVFDASNTNSHRWRIVGSEMMNSIVWEYRAFLDGETTIYATPVRFFPPPSASFEGFYEPPFPEIYSSISAVAGPALDGLRWVIGTIGPLDSDNVDTVGPREKVIRQHQTLEPLDFGVPLNPSRSASVPLAQGILFQYLIGSLSAWLLEIYQDGPVRYSGLLHGDLADAIDEGTHVIINEAQTKGANPTPPGRDGYVLALTLSLTRHPAHAEYEAMRIRPLDVGVFEEPCPV